MTMLDRMRRHKSWLKFSLGAVAVLMVIYLVPGFIDFSQSTSAANDVIATVGGREVRVDTYNRMYQQQLQSLRQNYGGAIDERMIRQLGIAERLITQLVDEQAVLAEADRLGIRATNGELRERLLRHPGLQENGQFVGHARYAQSLQMMRPPLRTEEFERQLRDQIVIEKLQAAVSGWVTVSDDEVVAEYRRRNEKVKLDLAVFTANQFRSSIQPSDAEIAAHYEANTNTYQVPEKRRVRYLAINADTLKAKMAVTGPEIEARYRENLQSYATPEQVRASHILLKTEGKDDAAVKKVAASVLAKVKAGGDFGALARQFSEDEASKAGGGDLDYFGRGAMQKEFEEAAWALTPGQVSDLVKTSYGYHIIKSVDKRAANTKSLAEVRPQVEDQIRFEKAQAEATRLAGELANEIKSPADLERVAAARGLAVGDSGLFARDEPLAGIGFSPEAANEAFTMTQDKVSGQIRTAQGFAFLALTEIRPPYVPQLAEVKDKVRDDVARVKAVDVARARAVTMAQAARSNFAAAAKAAGVEVKSTEFVGRGSALPEVGVSGAVDDAVFVLKAGETTAPITTDNAVVVARVKERQDIDPAKASTERDTVKDELLRERRGQFFAAYMTKAKTRFPPEYNETTIKMLLGG